MIREDFPDPESPVTTTSLFFGIVTLTFLRLLLLAPMISICLLVVDFVDLGKVSNLEFAGINLYLAQFLLFF
jgi:hypothetical protein